MHSSRDIIYHKIRYITLTNADIKDYEDSYQTAHNIVSHCNFYCVLQAFSHDTRRDTEDLFGFSIYLKNGEVYEKKA